ncbi:MAG: DUF4115 domain-containing protein [Armatimonadota bacterium]|nr:DUF4115 domain-containing protein [Armatimonadota bacterium]MDR7546758.1 DUF4115 domain-containing protein [Armatimonadota bacterium]
MDHLGIGERLRNAREARGLALEALERQTYIRAAYLQALEEERFDRLPGRAYVKGFLRTYAAALGLDPDRLLEAYPLDAELPPIVGPAGVEVPIRPAVPRSRLRRAAAHVALVVAAGAIIVGIVGYVQLREFNRPVPPEVAPSAPTVEPPPEPAPAPPSVPEPPPGPEPGPEPGAERPSPSEPAAGVTVEVTATGESWIRVAADGERLFQGIIREGDVRRWHARRQLTVRVGNAPAVQVRVNGRPFLPPPRRQVWEQTFKAPDAP